MKQHILYQDSHIISPIMCFAGCGFSVEAHFHDIMAACKGTLLPNDMEFIMNAEPHALGAHRVFLTIKSADNTWSNQKKLNEYIRASVTQLCRELEKANPRTQQTAQEPILPKNHYNIAINLLSIALIITLTLTLPSSIALTALLASVSLITTAYTTRTYLFNFFHRLDYRAPFNMNTTITLGWLLSCAHTLFHAISMPMGASFSMLFMNFIMPSLLILCINSMDEIKRVLLEKATRQQLQGINALFPNMPTHYPAYFLSKEQQDTLENTQTSATPTWICDLINQTTPTLEEKNSLREGMLIAINHGECIPVDCMLLHESALVDASLLTGESQQYKQYGEELPSGAVNLGQKIIAFTRQNGYNSTINQLLFKANRIPKYNTSPQALNKPALITAFPYVYGLLIGLSLIGSVAAPLLAGVYSIPILIQNVTGLLFSLCPCTALIAWQYPKLLHTYYLNQKKIHLRHEEAERGIDAFHTVVFDKTGTLTTNNSFVHSSSIPLNDPVWQRIYLLEYHYGNEHPVAKAIIQHYKPSVTFKNMFTELTDYKPDPRHRGLSAFVQGKEIHIGNASYCEEHGIVLPQDQDNNTLSAIYVAEGRQYKGTIYIQHELREGIIDTLQRLKNQKHKRIIMLTGDNKEAATALNEQTGFLFESEDIHFGQTPLDKDNWLREMMEAHPNPEGFCFIGDGLNDAPCCKSVSEQGGLSCSIEHKDKSVFFTDVCLNGSLDYLFQEQQIQQARTNNIIQNQYSLAYSTLISLAFIISFSIAGISVPAIIPMCLMVSTTLFVIANSHRIKLTIDALLEHKNSWFNGLASDTLLLIPFIGSALLVTALISATLATGTLTLPLFVFNAGPLMAISSLCSELATILSLVFTSLTAVSVFQPSSINVQNANPLPVPEPAPLVEETIQKTNKNSYSFFQTKNTPRASAVDPLLITPECDTLLDNYHKQF